MGENNKDGNNIPQFNGSGYDDWQFRIQLYFESVGLMDVLTDMPPTDQTALNEFNKKDKKAKDRLVSFVHSSCLGNVRDKNTAKEMWEALKSMFAEKSLVNQILIRKRLINLKLGPNDSVLPYIMAFENLIRQLKMAGAKVEEDDMLAHVFLSTTIARMYGRIRI